MAGEQKLLGRGRKCHSCAVSSKLPCAGPLPLEPGTHAVTSFAETESVARVRTRPLAFCVHSSAMTPAAEYFVNWLTCMPICVPREKRCEG